MQRTAVPMIGDIFSFLVFELLVYPGIHEAWEWHGEMRSLPMRLGLGRQSRVNRTS